MTFRLLSVLVLTSLLACGPATLGDGSAAKTVTRWQDAVLVVRHEGALLIDDFEFRGDWPFAQKGRPSEILAVPAGD